MNVRTRFAPSPTGHLHVGGARTAVLNWLLARHHGGSFVLRVEDTDRERNVPGAESAILDDLRWLGLDWDEGPDAGGPYAPYRQSERGELYRAAAERLLGEGKAYRCTCPPATEGGNDQRERCACAERSAPAGEGTTVRFRVPGSEVVVDDIVRGRISFPGESIEDFVLLRSDGRPTYNFAAVVDDAAMRITHVVRGVDHLTNTPKQVLLYEALDAPLPRFAHIPLILGEDRQKLSKRHGATSVAEHRREGYLPEALVNYLSLLSWSSPSGEEVLPVDRLVAEIDLGRVGASDAVFDRDKLRWLSSRYVQVLPPEEFTRRAEPYLDRDGHTIPEERVATALAAIQGRVSILSEVNEKLALLEGPRIREERDARRASMEDPEGRRVQAATRDRLAQLERWEESTIKEAIREAGKDTGVKGKQLFMPVRLALTGAEHGPDLPKIILVLGRRRSLELLSPEEGGEI